MTISNRFSPHSQKQKILRRGGKNTQKNYRKKKKKNFMTQIIMMV